MKNHEELILQYLNNNCDETDFNDLINNFKTQKVAENKNELKLLLHLICEIADNCHRSLNFFNKIDQILKFFENEMKQYFSNYSIFNIFKSNKRLLLFLFNEKILIPDKFIYSQIISSEYSEKKYFEYFYPEFKSFSNEEVTEFDIELFEKNRMIGENDQYICELIRDDLIDDFIIYVNRTNYSLSMPINASIFETNAFLLNNNPTLIEYAAFFGSIQILKYLHLNNVDISPDLFLYIIHGNNNDLVHYIEEKAEKPKKQLIKSILIEIIKCHEKDYLNYFKDNYYNNEANNEYFFFNKNLQYYNFYNICESEITLKKIDLFFSFCKYDYITLFDYLLKNENININQKKIKRKRNISFNHL
ncbi:hypothetical protein M9Y10_006288 [Tritrichomonas musculus]|uniref:DUF3447 domain-containing protein n=1 Tax=Tritrichomonas musculus TaxID=1915356 RepID=A0ABR2JDS5_9EUKA